jgi:endonuclease/exonuclease/phosphatase family metal-dependent hydrolase
MDTPAVLRRSCRLWQALPALAAALVLASPLAAQGLQDLEFGEADTFEVLTWNIEWFPKNGQITVDAVSEVIEALDVDLLALQEINDTVTLQQMVDGLPGYEAYYDSAWPAGLAYVYKTDTLTVVDAYEIYTTQPFWSAFPRSPMVIEVEFGGELVIVINNHFKCCGDGILDLGDLGDEETRRFTASNLLKQYIDLNHADDRVIVLGDLNDILTDSVANNVFQTILDDPDHYAFADAAIANGSSADWSYPTWPSHLDHLLITDELFDAVADGAAEVECIRIDDVLPGGWSEYDAKISDHRPVALKILLASEAWSDQGCALAGVSGDPALVGSGPLSGGSDNAADLSNAAPSATAGLFLALAGSAVPFKGGTLKPFPFFDPVILNTSPAGEIPVPFVMPLGLPAGTELWVQWAIQDAAAVKGVALSNAILGVTP